MTNDPMQLERRAFGLDGLVLERRDNAGPVLFGYAAVFDALSENLGGFRERIAPGAFAETIKNDDIRALWDHDSALVLGRNRAGTLKLAEDARGLKVEIDLPATPFVRDLVVAPIERGDVSQMSFGFSVRPGGEQWGQDDDGMTIRTLTGVRLFDVSAVAYPAYPQTEVALRALGRWRAGLVAAGASGAGAGERRSPSLQLLRARARQAAAG